MWRRENKVKQKQKTICYVSYKWNKQKDNLFHAQIEFVANGYFPDVKDEILKSDYNYNVITTKISKKDWEIIDAEKQLGRIWINESKYFNNIPLTAWEFYIGGYQPAQKWLKDRREIELKFEDILHYQKIIVALSETDIIMKEIDNIEIE